MRKIDIDTLRRNLQFQAARISGGDLGARVGGEGTGASSEEIENLKALIDSIDGQIDSIQVKTIEIRAEFEFIFRMTSTELRANLTRLAQR